MQSSSAMSPAIWTPEKIAELQKIIEADLAEFFKLYRHKKFNTIESYMNKVTEFNQDPYIGSNNAYGFKHFKRKISFLVSGDEHDQAIAETIYLLEFLKLAKKSAPGSNLLPSFDNKAKEIFTAFEEKIKLISTENRVVYDYKPSPIPKLFGNEGLLFAAMMVGATLLSIGLGLGLAVVAGSLALPLIALIAIAIGSLIGVTLFATSVLKLIKNERNRDKWQEEKTVTHTDPSKLGYDFINKLYQEITNTPTINPALTGTHADPLPGIRDVHAPTVPLSGGSLIIENTPAVPAVTLTSKDPMPKPQQ